MKEKFSLICTGGPLGSEILIYDGHLNEPLTVQEFINAVFEQSPNNWGRIQIWYTYHYLNYENGIISYTTSEFNNYLSKKIKSFTARGGWLRMDYTLIIEN